VTLLAEVIAATGYGQSNRSHLPEEGTASPKYEPELLAFYAAQLSWPAWLLRVSEDPVRIDFCRWFSILFSKETASDRRREVARDELP